MKIFSLETKKHLVGWSLFLALFVCGISLLFSIKPNVFINQRSKDLEVRWNDVGCIPGSLQRCLVEKQIDYGIPIKYNIRQEFFIEDITQIIPFPYSLYFNLLFWILVSLIVLSLIKHFRKKNNQNITNGS